MNILLNRFRKNGYPETFLKRYFIEKQIVENRKQQQKDNRLCIKVPYINEYEKRKILKLRKDHGLQEYVKVVFVTSQPLKLSLRTQKETRMCNKPCISCRTAKKMGQCQSKNVVYEITCNICQKVYIGETGRTIQQRILQHCKQDQSHVRKHMTEHQTKDNNFVWRILTKEANKIKRKSLESLYIQKADPGYLINGCKGWRVPDFLT